MIFRTAVNTFDTIKRYSEPDFDIASPAKSLPAARSNRLIALDAATGAVSNPFLSICLFLSPGHPVSPEPRANTKLKD
jgi:hypothetical protein